MPAQLRLELEAGAEEAVERLREVVRDPKASGLGLVRACALLIEQAYGRAGLASSLPPAIEGEGRSGIPQADYDLVDGEGDLIEALADAVGVLARPVAEGWRLPDGRVVNWADLQAWSAGVAGDLRRLLPALPAPEAPGGA